MSKQFARRFILFIILLIIINAMLDHGFKQYSVHNLLNERLDEQFLDYNGTLKYLAVGNSHNCVNTYILANSFNYGSPSESFIQTYYKLKHSFETTGKIPEYLIMQSDISSYGPKSANRYEYNSYWVNYIDFIELAKIKKDRSVLSKYLEGKLFSYAGNYKDIQLSIIYRNKMKNFEMYNGYRPHRDYKNFANNPNKQRAAFNKAQRILSKNIYFDPTTKVYLDKIMQLCQTYKVKVVMVKYPMTREFSTEERKIVPADKLYDEVDELVTRYSIYKGTFDYTDLYFDHPEYFFDPDHLNVKGSDLLTRRLAEDLKSLETSSNSLSH